MTTVEEPARVWSPLKTLLISALVILVGSFLVQLLVGAFYILLRMIEIDIYSPWHPAVRDYISTVLPSPAIISRSILISDAVAIGMVLWFVRRLSHSVESPPRFRDEIARYLAFQKPSWPGFVIWQAIMVLVFFAADFLYRLVGIEQPDFMMFMENAIPGLPLFEKILMLAALVIAAPVFEEILFRGFMFRGFENTRIKKAGAIILPSLIWAIIHIQYEFVWILIIFLMGIVFGLARSQTGSLYTVMSMHAINNLLSFIDILQ